MQFHANTSDVVARFEGPDAGGFTTATSFPDGSTLAAVCLERGGRTSLYRWRTKDWVMQEPIPLSDLVDSEHLDSTFPILADHMLLLAHLVEKKGELSQLDINTIALIGRDWKPVAFASMTVPRLSWTTLWSPQRGCWSVSPDGNCIVTGPVVGLGGGNWIIRRGATSPLKTDGFFLGFLPRGAKGVVAEVSGRFAVNERVASDRPPFWDLFRRSGQVYRVSLVDCATGKSLIK